MKDLLKCILGALILGFVVYSIQNNGQNVEGFVSILSNMVWLIVSGIVMFILSILSFISVSVLYIITPILTSIVGVVVWLSEHGAVIPVLVGALGCIICVAYKANDKYKKALVVIDSISERVKGIRERKYIDDNVKNKTKILDHFLKTAGLNKNIYGINKCHIGDLILFIVIGVVLFSLILLVFINIAVSVDYVNSFGIFSDFIIDWMKVSISETDDISCVISFLMVVVVWLLVCLSSFLIRVNILLKNVNNHLKNSTENTIAIIKG